MPILVALLIGLQIEIVSIVFEKISQVLNIWENYEKNSIAKENYTYKLIFFEFFNNFNSMFYIAFIKVFLKFLFYIFRVI